MKSYNDRVIASMAQNPEWCFDSKTEREIYTLFRENYLLPELQYRLGKYFIDFAFPKIKLAVEFDGPQHNDWDKIGKDYKRSDYILSQDWCLINIRPINNGFINALNWGGMDRSECYRHNLEASVKTVSDMAKTLIKASQDPEFKHLFEGK